VSVYVPPESLLDSKAFRRLLVLSLIGHVVLFVALTFRPHWGTQRFAPSPVMVNVVAAPPQPQARPAAPKAAPKPPPTPKPEVQPPPPPPKPVVNEVVIPKEVAALKPPKPKPVAKPEPKPKTAEELLADLTNKVEKEHPDSVPDVPAEAPPADTPQTTQVIGGPGVFDPVMSPWIARVGSILKSNWSGAQLCSKGYPVFDVDLDSGGAVESLQLATSSGDRYCDESAERAIRKSSPLPAPPRGAIGLKLNMSIAKGPT
jgi:TonB family protein